MRTKYKAFLAALTVVLISVCFNTFDTPEIPDKQYHF